MRMGCGIAAAVFGLIGANLFYNSFAHRTGDIADVEWRWVGVLLMCGAGLTLAVIGLITWIKSRKGSAR